MTYFLFSRFQVCWWMVHFHIFNYPSCIEYVLDSYYRRITTSQIYVGNKQFCNALNLEALHSINTDYKNYPRDCGTIIWILTLNGLTTMFCLWMHVRLAHSTKTNNFFQNASHKIGTWIFFYCFFCGRKYLSRYVKCFLTFLSFNLALTKWNIIWSYKMQPRLVWLTAAVFHIRMPLRE